MSSDTETANQAVFKKIKNLFLNWDLTQFYIDLAENIAETIKTVFDTPGLIVKGTFFYHFKVKYIQSLWFIIFIDINT